MVCPFDYRFTLYSFLRLYFWKLLFYMLDSLFWDNCYPYVGSTLSLFCTYSLSTDFILLFSAYIPHALGNLFPLSLLPSFPFFLLPCAMLVLALCSCSPFLYVEWGAPSRFPSALIWQVSHLWHLFFLSPGLSCLSSHSLRCEYDLPLTSIKGGNGVVGGRWWGLPEASSGRSGLCFFFPVRFCDVTCRTHSTGSGGFSTSVGFNWSSQIRTKSWKLRSPRAFEVCCGGRHLFIFPQGCRLTSLLYFPHRLGC